jgi:glutamate dehydrogenase
MLGWADPYKTELVDKVIEKISKKVSKDAVESATSFAREFYRHVPVNDLYDREVDDLYGAALGLWQFGKSRSPGQAKVRVFNPTYEADGWHTGHTVVEIVNDDMPFLVDSVTSALNTLGVSVHLVIHPVVRVERDQSGAVTDVCSKDTEGVTCPAESYMHIEVDEETHPERLAELTKGLEDVLNDVRAAVEDWRPMRESLAQFITDLSANPPSIEDEDVDEVVAFLKWLEADHFTFLGARTYRLEEHDGAVGIKVEQHSGLGILRDDKVTIFEGLRHNIEALPEEIVTFMREPHLLIVNKASMKSTVHRSVPVDVIVLRSFDDNGEVTGERVFAGLFTSVAYNRSARDIPYLRHKVTRCLRLADIDPRGHDGKALTNILDTYPRDELFQVTDQELLDTALGILALQERQRTALFVRRDPFSRFMSCLVYVPRDQYDTDLRRRMQAILEKSFNGTTTAFYTQLTEGVHARVHFIVKTSIRKLPDYDIPEIERALVDAARTWPDHLHDALIDAKGEERGLVLIRRYREAFPSYYQENTIPQASIFDVDRIETVIDSDALCLNLYRPIEASEDQVRLKLYHGGRPIPLSDVLPMLEHMGLKVIAENPYEITLADQESSVWIHDFSMRSADGAAIDIAAIKTPFQDALSRIWNGELEDDGFNRLVMGARLTGRQAMMLRAYGKYLRQAQIQFSQDALENTLATHPDATRLIVELFETLFDPDAADRDTRAEQITVRFNDVLDSVSNLDEDRILRRFINLVQSTLRTNYYQPAEDGSPKRYLAFKLDSREIEALPLPRPMVEVFVYSARMEGVHLRGGKVARGGIRWSDRREGFRTEILGLTKAHMVENAVIVPVGSKGGFVLKRPPPPSAGREALQAEGIEGYKTLMRGLLDITDNLDGDDIVHPQSVVRRDDDDPYLVVAADKGTATFSDIANGISQDYGFWLDDAYASGGSVGYDHKKMGITARGAWESVKRHFRELGLNTQAEPFTVIGVGDMSGDVFGNGMLLSNQIMLRAAFNHLHIFIDPNPDPAKSFRERQRLFEFGRGSWDQYDEKLISKGGGIFDRKAKSITLTPEICDTFGIDQQKMTPNEFLHALLKAQIDLLWFGGIGTYVKSVSENHGEVGDKANDTLRVNGEELGARVIGEGANLGVTQLGRIEAAHRGVKLNSDFIDNSAGVDCSDHEVKIKILLGRVVANGDMTEKQRNRLLESMTDDVASLVLRDNYLQTQALSMVMAEASDLLDQQARLMRALEKQGRLNREVELLPNDDELTERLGRKQGLTRPEIAVLLSYAKISLYDDIIDSSLPDDDGLVQDLIAYFPPALHEQYRPTIESHRLRRELIATSITNSIINRTGPTFVSETSEGTGMGPADIARAYLIVRDSFDLRQIWQQIEALDNKVDAEAQTRMMLATRRLIERATAWVLRHVGHDLVVGKQVEHFRPGVALLREHQDALIHDAARAVLTERVATYTDCGVPKALAKNVASLNVMAAGLDLIRIADTVSVPVKTVAPAYFKLGSRLGLAWLRDSATRMPLGNHWQKQATAAIIDDLYALQADLTVSALSDGGKRTKADGKVAGWLKRRYAPIDRIDQLIAELRAMDHVDISMLAVANRRLRGLTGG